MIQIAPTQVGECVTQESVCADVAAHVVLRVDVDVDVDVLYIEKKPPPKGVTWEQSNSVSSANIVTGVRRSEPTLRSARAMQRVASSDARIEHRSESGKYRN
eukprot:g1015.t1